MDGPSSGITVEGIGRDVTTANFVFKSDVVWNATGWFCGGIFRSDADIVRGKQYIFYFLRFSGLPAYFIDIFDNGFYKTTITDVQFSSDIDMDNGSTNQFAIVARENEFIVFVNGHRQSRFFDYGKQRMEGAFGFMAWQESGHGSCEYTNSWVWSLDQ
jgi:hypothetical protein